MNISSIKELEVPKRYNNIKVKFCLSELCDNKYNLKFMVDIITSFSDDNELVIMMANPRYIRSQLPLNKLLFGKYIKLFNNGLLTLMFKYEEWKPRYSYINFTIDNTHHDNHNIKMVNDNIYTIYPCKSDIKYDVKAWLVEQDKILKVGNIVILDDHKILLSNIDSNIKKKILKQIPLLHEHNRMKFMVTLPHSKCYHEVLGGSWYNIEFEDTTGGLILTHRTLTL